MNIVILAGGTGTRLWPMSRREKPKQFYEVLSQYPMIVETYLRFQDTFPDKKIFISTNVQFAPTISNLFPKIAKQNIIIEPEKRDTAAAFGHVACYLSTIDENEPCVLVPSDHFIGNVPRFLHLLKVAEKLILETGKMLDIGVPPNFPSTVLGYTRVGKFFKRENDVEVYRFVGHKEKPDLKRAKEYLSRGDYLWHTGYYMWTPKCFLESFVTNAPNMAVKFADIQKLFQQGVSMHTEDGMREISSHYRQLEKISFDYAVTEKMNPSDVLILKGDFPWSDIGAWDVLYEKLFSHVQVSKTTAGDEKGLCKQPRLDENNNILKGAVVTHETKNSLIYCGTNKVVAALGISDMIIVDTPDALLVCPKTRAQEVKNLVSQLDESDLKQYL